MNSLKALSKEKLRIMNILKLSACGAVVLAGFAGTVQADSTPKPMPLVKVQNTNTRPSAWKTWQNKTRNLLSFQRTRYGDYIRGNGSPEY
ncbi:MAG: hypothetical protein JWP89_1137 [Schlesneria sp.]|nr:hypothetical protein [Schlesneria sp.]